MTRADTRVPAVRQLSPHVVGHRVEAVEQQQREFNPGRSRHRGIIQDPRAVDKHLVHRL
jgi:hypothetical protein